MPTDEHGHSHTDLDRVDAKWTGTENGPVAEVGSVSESGKPGNESNVALSVLFILLLVALIMIPVAIFVQGNKEGLEFYKGFASWFESITGVSIL